MKPLDTTTFNLLTEEMRSKKSLAIEAAKILIKGYRIKAKCLTPAQYHELLKLV